MSDDPNEGSEGPESYVVDGKPWGVGEGEIKWLSIRPDEEGRLVRRVYGSACEVLESDGFSFFQIPEELLANLSVGRGLRR
jgi:hypothetical protein